MNNIPSQPTLLLPEIPANFEAMAGTSRTDFAKTLFDLLATSKITGINVEPSPYDLASLTAQVALLQEQVDALSARKFRFAQLTAGATPAETPVYFQDIGTTNYFVVAEYNKATLTDVPAITPIIKIGTKTTNSFNVRMDGITAATAVNFLIVSIDDLI